MNGDMHRATYPTDRARSLALIICQDIGNFVLQAIAARHLSVPFVCSGGVGDGKQLAAALALGCDGVNMGTRFMATVECPIKEEIKQALVDNDERSTTHVMRSVKNTERVFKNKTSKLVNEIESANPGDFKAFGAPICPYAISSCATFVFLPRSLWP